MKKLQIIDLVRTVCVLVVMGSHYYKNVPFSNFWTAFIWGRFCLNGAYGVYLFFTVSGFLITSIIATDPDGLFKANYIRFYVQRIGRLWPLLFLFVGLGLMIFLLFPENSSLYTTFFNGNRELYRFSFWFSVLTFSFNWFVAFNGDLNYFNWIVLWSLAVEEQFYLFYPLVLRKIINERNLVFLSLFLIVFGVCWRLFFYFRFPGNLYFLICTSPAKFDLIAIGTLLFLAVKRYGRFFVENKKVGFLLCLFGLIVVCASYFGTRENDSFEEIFSPELLGFGLFAFLLGGLHLPIFESKYLKIFSLPGKYCYGCYLFHVVIIALLRPFFNRFGVFAGFSVFVVLTTVTAAISYHFFELPTNHAIRKAIKAG